MRTLEKELDVELFKRHGPTIVLTAAGRRLYEISMPLVEGLDNIYTTFHERFTGSISGEVRIAAGPSSAGFLLPRFLKRFHEQHPRIRLTVKNVFSDEALKLLRAHEVDFAVGTMSTVPDDFQYRSILASEVMLAAPENHPLAKRQRVSVTETTEFAMIVPPLGTYTRYLWDHYAARHNVTLNSLVEVSGWWIVKKFVENGLGISALPRLCVGKGDRIALIPFVQPFPKVPYGLITHQDIQLSAAARRFIQMMVPDAPAAG